VVSEQPLVAFVVDVTAYVRKRGSAVPILNLSSAVFRECTDFERFWCINYPVLRIYIIYILAYTASEST
jgi:hypothetical protein